VTTKMLFVNHHNGAPRADTFIELTRGSIANYKEKPRTRWNWEAGTARSMR
jgi:hypothetical protein